MANGDLIRFRQGSRADVGTTAKQAGQLLFATYEDEILTTQGTESFVQGDIYVDLSDGPSGIRVNLANDVDKARTLFAGETSTNDAAGNWTATIDGITKLYDGLTIALRLNSTYNSTYNSLNVNNLGAKIVWYRKNTRLTSHVPNGAEILITYRTNAGSYTTPSSGSRTDIPKGTTCTDGWILTTAYDSNTVPSAYCTTGASTAAKVATCSGYTAMANSYIHIIFSNTNTANVPTLNINSKGAKPIYLNGEPVSSSNKNIKAGSYIAYYDGTAYYLRNDGILPGRIENALTADDATLATTASEAIKLSDTHTFQVDLGSTSVSTGFDGTQDIHDIGVTGTLSVQQGGTGTGNLASGEVLIGNNTNAVTTRAITNLTTAASDVTANTNLITANTLVNYKGSTNQNTVGTITTGTWHGSMIGISYGGTGMTSNPSMLINLESPDADTVFKATPRPGVTGVLGVGNGGTGRGSITSGELLVGNGTSAVTTIAKTNLNTANTVVQRDASGNFSAGTITATLNGSATSAGSASEAAKLTTGHTLYVDLESSSVSSPFDGTADINDIGVNGTLPVSHGGTGIGSLTASKILIGNGTNAIQTSTPAVSDGNITITKTTDDSKFVASNNNGTIELLASANRGVYDRTKSAWLIYGTQAGDHTYIPKWASKGSATQPVYFNSSGEPVSVTINTLSINGKSVPINNSTDIDVGTIGVSYGGTGRNSLTAGYVLVGNDTNQVSLVAKASANTPSAIVERDASGNFSAGTITASLSGNATSATTATSANQLSAGHTFQVNLASTSVSSSFNGTQDIHDIGVSGKLGVGYGGTGAGSFTAGALLQGNNTSAISVAATKGDAYTPIYINSNGVPTVVTGFYTQKLVRPNQLNGLNDATLQSLVSTTRANRLAFLPADQIIIEKTTDGGTTWVDAGVSDSVKLGLFSEVRSTVSIPLLNGVRNINCGIRITFTAMKYNVPEGTTETQKYNYWNSSYVRSAERYCQLKEFYFWVTSVNDGIKIKAERATGANSTTWQTIYDNDGWAATGWSGCDYIRFTQGVFGGGTNQTGNYWNYRLTFFTRNSTGGTTLATSSTSSAQSIYEIRGYGDTVWTTANNYMANDHLYKFDANKNATFPAKVTATEFSGTMNVSNLSGTVPVSSGGTGAGSFVAGALLQGNNTSAISAASAKGNSTTPIYIDNSGIPQTISSYSGNAATATALATGAKIGISGGITGTATNFTGASDISIPVTELNFNATGFNISGQLSVGNGGTGRSSLTEGQVLVGNGGSAVALRAILNNTAKSALGWNSGGATHTDNLRLVDVNTIAYWNGAYSGTNSNISYVGTISGGTWQGSTIGVSYGGTGITSNPSMTVNLSSNSADTVFKASPSPGVTGTLGVGNGGTGRGSLALNSTVVGNDSGQVKLIASANGAYYATSANAEPQFGILPEAQGGTGRNDLYTYLGNTYATISDLNNIISANDALIFKGVVDANHALPTTHSIGWTYKAGDTGTYAGQDCEPGDMIICIANGTTANDNDWVIVQANIDGAVTGPAQGSVQNGALAAFNGNSGKIITKASSAGTSTLPVYINSNGIATTISSYEGNSATATKLASGKTIAISGAVTGTATSFDGSSNITIPTTAIDISKVNSGKLAVSYGGTGVGNLAAGQLLVGNDTSAVTTIAKTSANTANTVVQRDANGNFSAGTITATLSGKASTAGVADEAAKLSNSHTFYVDLQSDSVSSGFDGTQDISDIGVTGTLPVGNGGTGATSFTANSLIQGNGTSALSAITSTIGSNVKPIYLSSGVPTATATEFVRAFDLSGVQDLNTKYDAGTYSIEGGSVSNYPANGDKYAAMLVIPYRKPSNNNIPDYAWQLATFAQNKDALWFRVSGASSSWRGWRNIVNIAANTAVGGEHAPVYVTADGIVTATGTINVEHGGTGLGSLTKDYVLVGNNTSAVQLIAKSSANNASTIVERDASGNFSAGTITATLSGNASSATTATTATQLAAGHTFQVNLGSSSVSSSFNGTQDIHDIGVSGKLSVSYGGTGAGSFTSGALLQGNSTNAISVASSKGDSSTPIYIDSTGKPQTVSSYGGNAATASALSPGAKIGISGGITGTATTFTGASDISIPVTELDFDAEDFSVTGQLGVANGGIGLGSLTANATLVGNGTSAIKQIASANGAYYATAANAEPQFGTLPVGQGGTGLATLDSGKALIGNGTSAVNLREITNNTTATAVTASTNLITANTLYYHKGNSNIVTVGTISTGTWQGTKVAVSYGGTGQSSLTSNATLVGNGTSAVKLISSASGAYYATSANGEPQFGTLPVAQGGTGKTSWTQWGVVYASASTTLTNTAAGTAGYPLIGAGSAAPAWYGGTVLTGSAAASWKTAINGTTTATSAGAGALTVAGGTYIAKNLYVGAETELNSTLSVGGNSTLSGTLSVSGATTIGGATQINNTLTVGTTSTNRATTLNGNLTVTGVVSFSNTTGASTDSNGAVRLAGGMSIKGNIIPTHNTYTLGDSDNKWKEIYVMSFVPDYTYTATKSVAGAWVDLFGGNQTTLETGTYIIQLKVGTAYYSGVCSWINTSAATGVTALYTEIPLHGVQISMAKQYYLRTALDASGLYLQISSSSSGSSSVSIEIKMKKIM